MSYVYAGIAPNKIALIVRMAQLFAPVENGVQVYDEDLQQDVIRSVSKFGTRDVVIARYNINESLIDAWSTILRPKVWDNGAESFSFFCDSLYIIDTYIRPLFNEGLVYPVGTDNRTRELNGETVPCLEVPNNKQPWGFFTEAEKVDVARFVGYVLDDEGQQTDQLNLKVIAL